jgi:hypothetical protein
MVNHDVCSYCEAGMTFLDFPMFVPLSCMLLLGFAVVVGHAKSNRCYHVSSTRSQLLTDMFTTSNKYANIVE